MKQSKLVIAVLLTGLFWISIEASSNGYLTLSKKSVQANLPSGFGDSVIISNSANFIDTIDSIKVIVDTTVFPEWEISWYFLTSKYEFGNHGGYGPIENYTAIYLLMRVPARLTGKLEIFKLDCNLYSPTKRVAKSAASAANVAMTAKLILYSRNNTGGTEPAADTITINGLATRCSTTTEIPTANPSMLDNDRSGQTGTTYDFLGRRISNTSINLNQKNRSSNGVNIVTGRDKALSVYLKYSD